MFLRSQPFGAKCIQFPDRRPTRKEFACRQRAKMRDPGGRYHHLLALRTHRPHNQNMILSRLVARGGFMRPNRLFGTFLLFGLQWVHLANRGFGGKALPANLKHGERQGQNRGQVESEGQAPRVSAQVKLGQNG
jgi:hypothetical protein